MTRVAVLCADRLSKRMAGPAIRSWEIARQLGRTHDVRVLVRAEALRGPGDLAEVQPDGFGVEMLEADGISEPLRWADVVVLQGYVMHFYPELQRTDRVLVADLYDPFHLESLEMTRLSRPALRAAVAGSQTEVVNTQLRLCDFFVCAGESQRDFWLGHLASLGRVNPTTYDADPSLRSLVDVVPFGVQAVPPAPGPAIRGVVPGVEHGDLVLLWGGGVYNWFDPLTVISAIDRVRTSHPRVRLFFLGGRHPNPEVPQMHMAGAARDLAERLGLVGKHVFFNEDWVAYSDRGAYLLDSDLGISAHQDHVETTYSFRTRVLDYLWAGLPVIATRGDAIARMVAERGLGLTVAPSDVVGWAAAIERMATDAEFVASCRRNVESVRDDLGWERVLEPLARFCDSPRRAPDLPQDRSTLVADRGSGLVRLLGRVNHHRRRGGWGVVGVHVRDYLSKALRRR